VPNFTTNATLLWKQYADVAFMAWTNTTSPQYIGGTTRFFNSGGVVQTDSHASAGNTSLDDFRITAAWPITNAVKWLTVYLNASTNVAGVRNLKTPITLICE
jgi:hypothetical protein